VPEDATTAPPVPSRPGILINPTLGSPFKALDVLGHELLHAADDCQSGHGRAFTKNSILVGYSGGKNSQATSKVAVEYVQHLAKVLGPYPHGALELALEVTEVTTVTKVTKAYTGRRRFECAKDRTVLYSTDKKVEEHGAPRCLICGGEMQPGKRRKKKVVTTIQRDAEEVQKHLAAARAA
jgi:hypothetical protein